MDPSANLQLPKSLRAAGDSIFKYVHTIRSQTETNFDDHFIQETFFYDTKRVT